jgi:chloramphenicol 3-O phosphotransferase
VASQLADLLQGLDVFLIGVHCDVDEIDRREPERGNRRIGEGRTHVIHDRIHTFGPYDLDLDTTAGVTAELVTSVLAAWRNRPGSRALAQTSDHANRGDHDTSSACTTSSLRDPLGRP